jgi:peroxiredoxin
MNRSVVLLVVSSVALLLPGCGGGDATQVEIGDIAPTFSLPAAGRTADKLTSDEFKGKITIVNFFSTTCAVCLKETEDLARVHSSGKAVVVGIALELEKDLEYLDRFVKDRGLTYPVALGDEATFSKFDGYAVPFTLVLDRSRVIRKKVYGRIEASELESVIDEIDRNSVALTPVQPTLTAR